MTIQQDLQQLADYFADAKLHDFEQIIINAIARINALEEQVGQYREPMWIEYGK